MSEESPTTTDLPIPGGRDVRATLDEPDSAVEPDAIVVACPPHPRHGGHRGDRRLVAVSDALCDYGSACLRFDYGEWDEGYGEREDVRNAIRWAAEEYDRLGVFGFSFGASLSILASATVDREVSAVSALAPTAELASDLEVVPALAEIGCPVQACYGERDRTVDWEPVVERAQDLRYDVRGFSSDHFFVGQHEKVARVVGTFLGTNLRDRAEEFR